MMTRSELAWHYAALLHARHPARPKEEGPQWPRMTRAKLALFAATAMVADMRRVVMKARGT